MKISFFDRFFGRNTDENWADSPIQFGRYSDSYKTVKHHDAWDKAEQFFEKGEYLKSYTSFLEYLKDEKEHNVYWQEEKGVLNFELYQGSKKIIGQADEKKIRVEAKIVRAKELHVGFLRELITKNFTLEYSRYALDAEQNITIVFDSFAVDSSPFKLYYALRELAINADKQDDLLTDEFPHLQSIEINHLVDLPAQEKQIKYDFVITKIKQTLAEVEQDKLRAEKYTGGVAYLMLDLCYRLDFLAKPEGFMMEILERIHRQYFSNNGAEKKDQKNEILRKGFVELLERSQEDFFKEMYKVRTTFGITKPIDFNRVRSIIEGELPNMDWYQDHGYEGVALSVPGYIAGHCLFNYAVPRPLRDFFQLYYQITEPAYFKQLGFSNMLYNAEKKVFDKRSIRQAIRNITRQHQEVYLRLSPQTAILKYDNLPNFCRSYLQMLAKMDLYQVT